MSKSKPIVMDGAMGTMLIVHGVPLGSCFESLNLSRPALIEEIHRSYLQSGAEALVANTFGANRPRLSEHGSAKKLEAINRAGVRIAKKAAGRRPVFASIGPLGRASRRMGFADMLKLFQEQVRALEKETPAGYLVETMTSLGEAEAATVAARGLTNRKILTVLAPFPKRSRPTPDAVSLIASTLRSAGADAIGANCGTSPEDVFSFIKALRECDDGPLAVRASGGTPEKPVSPEDFADWGVQFQKLGCVWIGGCCGTTPAHIRALKESL